MEHGPAPSVVQRLNTPPIRSIASAVLHSNGRVLVSVSKEVLKSLVVGRIDEHDHVLLIILEKYCKVSVLN